MDTVNVLSKDLRSVIRKEVDFIPGAWVEFFDSVTPGDVKKAQKLESDQGMEASQNLLLSQIAAWNFAGEDKKILPLTIETLDMLPMKISTWIAETEAELMQVQEAKKKETSTETV